MQIINKPIHNLFFEMVSEAQDSIKLCVPFVKKNIVKEIYQRKRANTKISLITNVNLMNFHRKASDTEALESILDFRDSVTNLQRLHAKIYIFDDKYSRAYCTTMKAA